MEDLTKLTNKELADRIQFVKEKLDGIAKLKTDPSSNQISVFGANNLKFNLADLLHQKSIDELKLLDEELKNRKK